MDDFSLLFYYCQPVSYLQGNNIRQYNISNNSEWLNDEDAVNHDSSNSFLSMDRNWTYQL